MAADRNSVSRMWDDKSLDQSGKRAGGRGICLASTFLDGTVDPVSDVPRLCRGNTAGETKTAEYTAYRNSCISARNIYRKNMAASPWTGTGHMAAWMDRKNIQLFNSTEREIA